MNEWFQKEWAGLAQVFQIRRTVTQKGEERREIVYGITNAPRTKADAKRLLELNRKHWWIENRLHYPRDVTDGEKMLLKCVREAGPRSLSRPQWGITRPAGFCGGEQCGQANEAFLCTTARSPSIAAWQAFQAIRVN
jgi:hypothetical protein